MYCDVGPYALLTVQCLIFVYVVVNWATVPAISATFMYFVASTPYLTENLGVHACKNSHVQNWSRNLEQPQYCEASFAEPVIVEKTQWEIA